MISSINHIGISTLNFDRSLNFYQNIIGMDLVIETRFKGKLYDIILALKGTCGRIALLKIGEVCIELFEFNSPRPEPGDLNRPVCDCGITHLCFDVKNIDEEYARLLGLGVTFHCPPLDFGGIAKATYGRDPDGNVFELRESFDKFS